MRIDRKNFLDEMGDTELTLDSYKNAPQEDELGELHYPEQEHQAPAAESPAAQEQPATEQEKPVTPDEYLKILDEQNRLHLQRLESYMRQQQDAILKNYRPAQEQQPAQEEEYLDPYSKLERQSENGIKTAMQALTLAERAAERMIRQDFERTVAKLEKELPDLYEFLPKERLQQALDYVVQNKEYDTNWERDISTAHMKLSHAKYREQYHKSNDELAKKREEKKSESTKAVRAVAPGGSTYQAQKQPDLSPFSNKNYAKDRKAAFLADLNALTGG